MGADSLLVGISPVAAVGVDRSGMPMADSVSSGVLSTQL